MTGRWQDEWPEGLLLLRGRLKRQGVDVDNLKTERQMLFHGKVPVMQGQDAADRFRETLAA